MSSPEPSPSTAQSTLVNSSNKHSTARKPPSLDNTTQVHLLPPLSANATPQVLLKNAIPTQSNQTASSSSDLALSLAATLTVTERQKDERIANATIAMGGPCIMAVQQNRKDIPKHASMTTVYEEVPLESRNDESYERDEWKHQDRLQSTMLRVAALLNEQIEACENLERTLKGSGTITTTTSTGEGTKLNPGYDGERDTEVKVNGGLILNHEISVGCGGGEIDKSAMNEQLTALRKKAEAALGLVAETLTARYGS